MGGESVFWARIENGYYGVWALRRETKPTIVRAIRADEARAGRDIDAWMRWFAQELWASEVSPLGPGHWHLTELVPEPSSTWNDLFVPRHGHGLPGPAFDLMSSLERPLITYEDWGSNGSAGVIPLRRRRDTCRRRVTHAKANPALDETWDVEVCDAAPADSDDLKDMLFDN